MLLNTSSLATRCTGLILILFLSVACFLRLEVAVDTLLVHTHQKTDQEGENVNHMLDDTKGKMGRGRHTLGDHVPTAIYMHEVRHSRHHSDEVNAEKEPVLIPQTSQAELKQIQGRERMHKLKPRDTGGQIRLKQNDVIPGQRKTYGMTPDTSNSRGRRKIYAG